MKNKFLLLCLLAGVAHNAYIMSSYEDHIDDPNVIQLLTQMHRKITVIPIILPTSPLSESRFHDNEEAKRKYLFIANLIEEHKLTVTQAEDAFKKGLSTEQALEAAQAGTLKTLEQVVQTNRTTYFKFAENGDIKLIKQENYFINHEREYTNRYTNTASFIRSGLSYPQATIAHHHSLTLEQAVQMKDMLYEHNGNSDNNSMYDKIITQIKKQAKKR